MSMHVPERWRVRTGPMASDESFGNNGMFLVRIKFSQYIKVIASDGEGWEHVSASRDDRCPLWEEMCEVKNMFWDANDCIVQFHPPESDYVNCHPYCLHLWRPTEGVMPMPPKFLVGPTVPDMEGAA